MLDYCWQCGSQLVNSSNEGNYYQSNQVGQGFNYTPQNNYTPAPTQGFNYYGQNYTPNYQPQPRSASFGRIAAVLGGIFVFLLLVTGAGAAVIYKVIYTPRPNPYYTDYRPRNPEPVKPAPVKESDSTKINPTDDKSKSDKASTKFEKIWVDYNVTEGGRYGMRIHVKFSVYNMKNVDSYLGIYFQKSDGTKLMTTNKKFASKEGQVAVYRTLKPGYDSTIYQDMDVFMPYDELKLGKGKYDLKMDADVIYANGNLLEHLGDHEFTYEKK